MLEERERTTTIRLGAFYARRARRLLPVLAVFLGLFATVAAAEAMTGQTSDARGIAYSIASCLLYASNVWRASGHFLVGPLTQMWSLAQEEQFYLLWPPLLMLLLSRGVKLGRLAVGLAAAAVTVMMWRAHLGPGTRTYFAPDTRCDPLVIGCLLAVLRFGRMLPRIPRPIIALAAAALAVDVVLTSNAGSFTNMFGFPIVGISTAVLIAAVLQGSRIAQLLQFQPLVELGIISYSLYIWQGLAFTVDGLPGGRATAIAPAILMAWLSYRYVEQPYRRRRQRAGITTPTPVTP